MRCRTSKQASKAKQAATQQTQFTKATTNLATNAPLAQDDPETKHTAKQLEITMWLNKNHCTKHQQAHHFTQNTKRRGLCANKAKTSHELQQTSPPTRRGNQRVTERSTQCATSRALTKRQWCEMASSPESKETNEHQQEAFGKLNNEWQAVDG